MTEAAVQRPAFFEGQYLGADDLDALMEYFRSQGARNTLGLHTWGVAVGLELVERTSPDNEPEVVVTPGFAVDGYGRQIVVLAPTPLTPSQFEGVGSGEHPIWIRYDAAEGEGVRRGFEVCTTDDTFRRIHESFEIEVGPRRSFVDQQSGITVAGELLPDPRLALRAGDPGAQLICDASVPQQEFRSDDVDPRWLIPLGLVHWLQGPASFQALTDEQKLRSRLMRRAVGSVVETINAANGVIRLRNRGTPYDEAAGVSADDACGNDALQSKDLRYCNDAVNIDDLVWLEGNTRLTANARLWGGDLEFRNLAGNDYVDRTIDGLNVPKIAPLILRRLHENEIDGSDLQVLLGQEEEGKNRLIIADVGVAGDECDVQLNVAEERVAIQSNGLVGIGTFNPYSELESPLTIRGIEEEGEILTLENKAGVQQWSINLGEGEENLNFIEKLDPDDFEGRLFLQGGGRVGISTTQPEAKLDVQAVTSTPNGSPLGTDMWFRVGNGGDDGRAWIEYGSQAAPLLVLSDLDNPPRIQFQQGAETAPGHVSWIGHAAGNNSDIAIMGADVGIGTTAPSRALHIKGDKPDIFLDIDGASSANLTELRFGSNGSSNSSIYWSKGTSKTTITNQGLNAVVVDGRNVGMGTPNPATTLHIATGSDAGNSAGSGYLVIGSNSGTQLGLDPNEIQARAGGGGSSMLYLQYQGGGLNVGNSKFVMQDAGDVGINAPNPTCRLHVRDSISGGATTIANHVAYIENSSTGNNADVLALSVGRSNPGDNNNYITFFAAGNAIGRIERDGGTLRLRSGGADFAECLNSLDADAKFEPGDVVGVHGGRISHCTSSADRVLVVTDSAVVVGNSNGTSEDEHDVAMMGQARAKVVGPVKAGDLIVASGFNDGTAKAVPSDLIDPGTLDQVVGQAWESDDGSDVRRINVAVNLLSGLGAAALANRLTEISDRIELLERQTNN